MQMSGLLLTILAYLDPGTGSLIIQMIVGAIASFFLFFKGYWYRLKGLFQRNQSADSDAP